MAKRSRALSNESPPSDYVSVWFWMFAQLLLALPLINLVAMLVLAFHGENRSRKNFFRALLMWLVLVFGLHLLLFVAIASPSSLKWLKDLWAMAIDLVSLK